MNGSFQIEIVTPGRIALARGDIIAVRARDASGSFGIRPGHADLMTVLPASVVSWRAVDGETGFCAVRGGVLTMSGGKRLAIACREALPGQRIEDLESEIVAHQAGAEDSDRAARTAQMRLHAQAVRQIVHFLSPARGPGGHGLSDFFAAEDAS